MSALDNLQKAKKYIAGANFVSSAIMIVIFFILRRINPDGESYWILVAGIVFALAGIAMIAFVKRLEKRFKDANIR